MCVPQKIVATISEIDQQELMAKRMMIQRASVGFEEDLEKSKCQTAKLMVKKMMMLRKV